MPDKWTFNIKPIKQLLSEEIDLNAMWIDPYCGINGKWGMVTNDLNPNHQATFHLDALEFLKRWEAPDMDKVDGVLFDPPYSLRQLKECYESIGIKPKPDIFCPSH